MVAREEVANRPPVGIMPVEPLVAVEEPCATIVLARHVDSLEVPIR